LRRSGRLVQGKWVKVTSLIVIGGALAVVVGPIVGALLILGTDAPFWLVNVVAGVIYALTMPLVAITTAYVYFDRRVADALAGDREPAVLPAEIELSG
jgi:predicted membrane metal-binding protein